MQLILQVNYNVGWIFDSYIVQSIFWWSNTVWLGKPILNKLEIKHPNLWYMNYIHNILLFYSQVTVWMKKFWNSIVGCIVRLTYLQILKAIVLDKDKVIIRCTTATTNGYLFFWSSRQYYFTYPESSGWCLKEVSNVHRSSVFHYKSQCLSSIDWYNVLYSQVWWSFWGKEQLEG